MKKQLMVDMIAVLETLAEAGSNSIPGEGSMIASHVYLALGSDIERYEMVKRVLVASKLVTATAETVTITAFGRAKVEEIAKLKAGG